MRNIVVLIASITTLLVATKGLSATPQRWNTGVSGTLSQLEQLRRTQAKVNQRFPLIKLKAKHVVGLGALEFVFPKRKLPPAEAVMVSKRGSIRDSVVPTLLQGKVFRRNARRGRVVGPVSLSIIKNRAVFQFNAYHKRGRIERARVVSLSMRLHASNKTLKARISSKPNSMFAGKECHTHAEHRKKAFAVSARSADTPQTAGFELYKIITISTEADEKWWARYGDESNAEIAATINAAEAVYQEQLGIRFAIVRQHVYAEGSPYASSDASALLTSFRKNPENPANLGMLPDTFDQDVDVKYLFTGRELDGATIGLSYVGAMCWSPKDAYGLVQNVSRDINISAFLHEMGHTLGAHHDETDGNGIMFPQLSANRRYFSQVSLQQITRHLSSYGKCITEELLRPNLSSATLTVKRSFSRDKRRVIIKGALLSAAGNPLVGEMVKLTLNQKRVVMVATDELGLFKYSLERRRFSGKRLVVSVQPARDESAQLATIKIPLSA